MGFLLHYSLGRESKISSFWLLLGYRPDSFLAVRDSMEDNCISRLSDNTFWSCDFQQAWEITSKQLIMNVKKPKMYSRQRNTVGMRACLNESRITISFMQICNTGHCLKFPGIKQWKVWNEGAASAWQAINVKLFFWRTLTRDAHLKQWRERVTNILLKWAKLR